MTKQSTTRPEPESFEAALAEIELLVGELEAGNVPLERSLEAFERGKKLLEFCERKLRAAEQSIRQLGGESENESSPS